VDGGGGSIDFGFSLRSGAVKVIRGDANVATDALRAGASASAGTGTQGCDDGSGMTFKGGSAASGSGSGSGSGWVQTDE